MSEPEPTYPLNNLREAGLADRIKNHEGCKLVPYTDTRGVWTIGYGHRMDNGISLATAEDIFQEDLVVAYNAALSCCAKHGILPGSLRQERLGVLVEMAFQMGQGGLLTFKRMWAALAKRAWDLAAKEMRASAWAQQTPARCHRLAMIMQNGHD